MTRKTIHRYRYRWFQRETELTLEGDQWRLTPMPTGITRAARHPGHWSIRWLAERWVIDFPNGLHRARHCPEDAIRYRIGRTPHQCELDGVVYLAGVGQDGAKIVKHETFPDPDGANPEAPDDDP
jgi:hypothetical protein